MRPIYDSAARRPESPVPVGAVAASSDRNGAALPAPAPGEAPAPTGDVEWLTSAEAARYARRNVVTIRRAAEAGRLHGHQTGVGGRWTFKPSAVEAFVKGDDGVAACGCTRLKLARRRSA